MTPTPPAALHPEAGDDTPDAVLRRVLDETRVIAVVGMSDDPARPSHYVARFLQDNGYRIVPVNPNLAGQTLLGETVHAGLDSIPAGIAVDMVDLFRRPAQVPAEVDLALAHLPGLRTIWMQVGIRHPEAAARARARGITVIENRCPKMELPRLRG